MSLNIKLAVLVSVLALAACKDISSSPAQAAERPASQQVLSHPDSTVAEEQKQRPVSEAERLEQSLADFEKEIGIKLFEDPWTGDLDVMLKHRLIRVLTVYGLGRYFLDGVEEKGITFDFFKMFENFVNEKSGSGNLRIHVVFIPVARDQLIPALINGRGDIAAAGLTITPERAEIIDFSEPVSKPLSEVLVSGPAAPEIRVIEDLAGASIHVRKSSSYYTSLLALNRRLAEQGLEEIEIEYAPEQLEDEDILEMVNAGLVEWAVVDDYKAELWSAIFENLTVRDDLKFRSGGRLGFAMRQNSPQLEQMLNEFLKTHRQGTLKGNILINRYLKGADWAKNALDADDYKRFQNVAELFSKYGDQYGVDYLMVAAQGYQESRLDQSARSAAGAVGIMQLLPSTAADSNVGIPDITSAETNIHAGVKYLDFIRKRYFSDSSMDRFNQTMFAFAAYNAGPARIRKLREKAEQKGYDPNIWFDNVEIIAAQEIGRETVQYVANILKYYVAYRLSVQQELDRKAAREAIGIN